MNNRDLLAFVHNINTLSILFVAFFLGDPWLSYGLEAKRQDVDAKQDMFEVNAL